MGEPTYSAGGILLKREDENTYIIIVEWENNVPPKWAPVLRQLPKGGCRQGETSKVTALREVHEETGYHGKIISKAGEAHWSYERGGKVWDEQVVYYFMKPLSLTPDQHDDEFDNVRWIEISEAIKLLSYPEERDLILAIINSNSIPVF